MPRGRTHVRARRTAVMTTAAVVVIAALCGCASSSSSSQSSSGSAATATATQSSGSHSASAAQRAPSPASSRRSSTGSPGRQTKTSGCQARGQLPDPACTPGGVFPSATVSVICVSGYTQRVRNVSSSTKDAVYAAYGIASHRARQYEVDHLVPLELGGNNAIANLWPEVTPGYGEKDSVENELHGAVCSGQISLHTAQVQIARDWRHAGVSVPAGSGGRSQASSTPARPRPSSGSTSPPAATDTSFCATHQCIASFAAGRGSIVQCADGEYSHSGGLPGVCSHHGGPR
jgi:hypothetical protein